jgi:hypothetical protein
MKCVDIRLVDNTCAPVYLVGLLIIILTLVYLFYHHATTSDRQTSLVLFVRLVFVSLSLDLSISMTGATY